MTIGDAYIPSELATRATRLQHPAGGALPSHKARQVPASGGSEQHKTTSESIIEAEYVDLYQPTPRPPEQNQHWHSLIVEDDKNLVSITPQSLKPDPHQQQLIERYADHSGAAPLPGRYLNLLV
ncbi:MAG: hypothetical protein R6V33_08955 [Pelovirga sp.]